MSTGPSGFSGGKSITSNPLGSPSLLNDASSPSTVLVKGVPRPTSPLLQIKIVSAHKPGVSTHASTAAKAMRLRCCIALAPSLVFLPRESMRAIVVRIYFLRDDVGQCMLILPEPFRNILKDKTMTEWNARTRQEGGDCEAAGP